MPALVCTPTYPRPGETAQLRVTPTAGGNFARLKLTDAPLGSEEKAAVLAAGGAKDYGGIDVSTDALFFTPTAPGVYVFAVTEYRRGASTTRGGYAQAPENFDTETALATSSLSVYVAQQLELTLGVDVGSALLRLWVAEGKVLATGPIDGVGETTPILEKWSNEKSRLAASATSVQAAITALGGVAASTVFGSLQAVVNDIATKFTNHAGSGTFHSTTDTDNAIATAFRTPTTPEAVIASAQRLTTNIRRHFQNDGGAGIDTVGFHAAIDWSNLPVVSGAGSTAQAMSAVAALWYAFEAHRVTGHLSPDAANALTPLPPLLQLVGKFCHELRLQSPTAPPSVHAAAALLVAGGGFTPSR